MNATNAFGSDLTTLIAERNETPKLLGADDRGNELFAFSDNTRVIQTNALLVNEDEDAFAELEAEILGQ